MNDERNNIDGEFDALDLERMRERISALPREVAPSANAWENIRRRIEATRIRELPTASPEVVSVNGPPAVSDVERASVDEFRMRRLHSQRRTRTVMLIAASFFIVVTSVSVIRERGAGEPGLATIDSTSGAPTTALTVPETASATVAAASAADTGTRAVSREVESSVAAAIAQYSLASDDMARDFEARRAHLQPEALAVVDSCLQTLDRAIRESKDALKQSPTNATIVELLQVTYQQKLDLLRRSADLPTVSLQD